MGFARTVETIKEVEKQINDQEKRVVEERNQQLQLAREKQKQLTKELNDALVCEKNKELECIDQQGKEMLNQSKLSAQGKIEKLRLENEKKEEEVIAFILSRILE